MTDVMDATLPQPDATDTPSGAFHAILVIEGERTTDHREFAPNSLSWRTLPLPLMWQRETSEGHKGSVVVGKITRIERRGAELHGWGEFDLNGTDGKEAFRLVGEQIVRGISIDAELMEIDKEKLVGEEDGQAVLYVLEGRIGAATLVSFPAFPSAVIALADADIPEADANGRGEAIVTTAVSPKDVAICKDECGDDEDCMKKCMEKKAAMYAALDHDPFLVTDKPWDGSSSRFTAEEYERASAGCREDGSASKSSCFLPHHEPDGQLNRRAVIAAASRFNLVNAPASSKAAARAHLVAHFTDDLKIPVPNVLTEMALVAHAEKQGPPAEWFDDPQLKGPTPLTVARNGRIYGHLATWGACHIGYRDCMRPPRSKTNYAHFKVGQVFASECDCDEGIPTGVLTLGTTHADLYATPDSARRHYDNTGAAVADVSIGEDEFGPWIAGALRPGVTDAQIRAIRGSAPSGDWRYIGGNLELVNILLVNTPGFPIPRVAAGLERGVQVSLVAAGIEEEEITPIEDDSVDPNDLIAGLIKKESDAEATDQEGEGDEGSGGDGDAGSASDSVA